MYAGIACSPLNLATLVLNRSLMNITWTTPTIVGEEEISITFQVSSQCSSCIEGVRNTSEDLFIIIIRIKLF